jgi:catalytic LigB subunit of aromatic ring-opening dioxygenase
MATIVGGFASSHTPLMSLPGQDWAKRADDDKRNRELIRPTDGKHVTYDELLESADPKIADQIDEDIFCRKYNAIQMALNELQDTFAQVNPDVVVMFGDDQDEMFFDDNYPMISVYWGDTLTHYPRMGNRPNMSEAIRISAAVYGTEIIEYPVQTELGKHLVAELAAEHDFDVAQSRYMKPEYGGTIGPGTWYLNYQRSTQPRRQGMAHAFAFPVCRWFHGKRPPMVPITINTCYPPNWISPRRAYALGQAVRQTIESWDNDARVAIVTSGGLSHFTVDEEIDRLALAGLTEADGKILSTLPRWKLQSATTEILNWVAAAGAMDGTPMELITYQPGYRSPAGTGCGCAVGRWTPGNGNGRH